LYIAGRAESLKVEHDIVAYNVLCIRNYVQTSVLGQTLFQFPVTVDCSNESVYASFEADVRVFKIVSDHLDHRLVDVHEGSSEATCCGFYIVAVLINSFTLVCSIGLYAEVFVPDG
jgi:hypothetical protein